MDHSINMRWFVKIASSITVWFCHLNTLMLVRSFYLIYILEFKCLKCDHLNVKNTSISYPDREDEPNQVADNHFTKVDNSEPKAECHAE